LYSIK